MTASTVGKKSLICMWTRLKAGKYSTLQIIYPKILVTFGITGKMCFFAIFLERS